MTDSPVIFYKYLRSLFFTLLVSIFLGAHPALADVAKLLAEGDKALAQQDNPAAEAAYSKALEEDPDNFRTLKSLAELKVHLQKYKEANALIDKILAMKVTNGAQVLVTLKGEPELLEAELVDETVTAADSGKNNMRNYLSPVGSEPVYYYRLFFHKSGKMRLILKTDATLKYKGVPRHVHQMVVELQSKVKNKIIAGAGSEGSTQMVSLEGGCFLMGSKNGYPIEQPVHEVCIRPFKMDKYEVSQGDFQAKMGANPSRFKGANLPVESLTWDEAFAYCKKSSKRLPTEAEWEYAARAGSSTAYYWGDEFDTKKSNYCDSECDLNIRDPKNSDGFKYTAPVGTFPANPLGLHDMEGNVNEWVQDWMEDNYYRVSPKDNPTGPTRQSSLVHGGSNKKSIRGGSWGSRAEEIRPTNRKGFWIEYRLESVGFRCAANP